MSNYWIRENLSSAIYPLASEWWGRSIILHQQDQNYDTTTINAPGVVIDKGIPQAYYMHNVVPTQQGYQSVGYSTLVNGVAAATDFGPVYPIQTADGGRFLFCPAAGKNYIYSLATGQWNSVSPFAPGTVTEGTQVTTAFVHGETYIYYANLGCYIYDPAGNVLVLTALTSLVAADIIGVCAANNYMIAFTETAIAWSSALTPTDFTPSIVTGAGSGSINEAKGNIIVCLQISGGFIAYCDENAVFARYTGNINFPFVTKEVIGSGGLADLNQVSWQSNLDVHYAWTSAGLQQVGPVSAAPIYSEISDFFGAKIFEDFNEATLELTSEYIDTQLYLSVKVIEERFMIVSFGKTAGMYTHAIFYDFALKRYGRLKVNHVACFEWNFPNFAGSVTYGKLINTTYAQLINTTYGQLGTNINPPKVFKSAIAFVEADGTVKVVDFDVSGVGADGVIILGKYQLIRNNRIEHQATTVDTIADTENMAAYVITSQDGKTFDPPVSLFLQQKSARARSYVKYLEGQCFSYLFTGAYNLTSLQINITIGGSS